MTIINTCESLTNWSTDTNGVGTGSIDSTDYTTGSGSIKYIRTVDKTRDWTSTIRLTLASSSPYINYEDRYLSFDYKWDNAINETKVAFLDSGGSNISGTTTTLADNVTPDVWHTAVIPMHGAQLSDIKYFDVYNDGDKITGHADEDVITLHLDNIKLLSAPRRQHEPYIVFQFDDGYQDNLTEALPLFQQYGHTATIGMVPDFFSSTYLTLSMLSESELGELADAGWEIASHSLSHTNLSGTSEAATITQMEDSRDELVALGHDVKHLIYPFTQYSATSYEQSKNFYESASIGTPPRVNPIRQNNIYKTDPHLLNRYALTSTTTQEDFNNIVDDAIASDALLIVYAHDVNNSANSSNTITPAQLEGFLKYLNQKGVGTMTTSKALREYGLTK